MAFQAASQATLFNSYTEAPFGWQTTLEWSVSGIYEIGHEYSNVMVDPDQ